MIKRTIYALVSPNNRIVMEFGSEELMREHIKRQEEKFGSSYAARPAKVEKTITVTLLK